MVNSVLLWRCGGKHNYENLRDALQDCSFLVCATMPCAYSLLSSHHDHFQLKGSIESCHINPSFWYGPKNHREVLEYNFPSQRNDVLRP